MRNFLSTANWSRPELQGLIDRAVTFKDGAISRALDGKSIALLFFNPSLRTRSSFDIGAFQLGGHAIVLDAKGQTWPLEFDDGVIMDGSAEEHIRESARVLSSYADLIAIRCFPEFKDWNSEREDPLITAFAKHATVPVINMETIVHPCQELALMMAMQNRLGDVAGKEFLLTWVPHPKPLNTAVANSALLIASKFGMNVRMLIPDDVYRLDERYVGAAEDFVATGGGSLSITTDVKKAYEGADAVYAKSWGALPFFGQWEGESSFRELGKDFMITPDKMAMTNNAVVSHCLPMRRNVKMTDAVADSPAFMGIEEAGNRLHVQKAIMETLIGHNGVSGPTS
jgi:N-acetylornithine carbamoyltransferase